MLNVDSVKFHAPVQEHVSLNTQRTNVRQKRYKNQNYPRSHSFDDRRVIILPGIPHVWREFRTEDRGP